MDYECSFDASSQANTFRCWWPCLLLALALNAALVNGHAASASATLKAAALEGDPQAQTQLGNAYLSAFDYAEAAKWYGSAAEKGVAQAQYRLGDILLNGRPAPKPPKPGAAKVTADATEAVQWFSRAANKDHLEAQFALGQCFRDGKGVKKDLVRAYKWLTLASEKNNGIGKLYRDPILSQMSVKQITEGERLVANFKAGLASPSPYLSKLVLQAIGGKRDHRLATINDRTFTDGEESLVQVGTKWLRVKCVEVREKSAVVNLLETGEETEIVLH
jgi:TPR repeat protein